MTVEAIKEAIAELPEEERAVLASSTTPGTSKWSRTSLRAAGARISSNKSIAKLMQAIFGR
jgi:hypothetical protein